MCLKVINELDRKGALSGNNQNKTRDILHGFLDEIINEILRERKGKIREVEEGEINI